MFLRKLKAAGVELKLSNNGENLRVITDNPLTNKQRNFIRLNKSVLIKELASSNDQVNKMFVYRLEFDNGDSMIWRCNFSNKEKAIARLGKQFIEKKVKSLVLMN